MSDLIDFFLSHSGRILWWLEVAGAALGFAYMYFEYKAKFALWPVGIVWSLCYLVLFWIQGFYAWSLTWIYYLFANVYGLLTWQRNGRTSEEYPITRMKKSWRFPVLAISFLLTIPLWIFVRKYNPYVHSEFDMGSLLVLISESLSTSLGIVAMYLLAKKVAEQWIFWIVVNSLYLVANAYIADWPLALFYLVYTTVSVLGWIQWKREAKKQDL